ncbi:hypothetical protein [Amycolatopsis sp. CA-230715]|uniref:hypothetical protein n=1 Tax=Amycolatopsis sp. CA-230715 TaxID=2745196 RepID=UPI001C021B5C|nr:hypothetical protein [Amycolatopsis sp. CA-230715]QWF83153.1 hypothetical protein HUW46_06593 [Amycolatopsis sp. CA-230715]
MNVGGKLITGAVTSALIGTTLLVGAGVSQADTVYEFRMSQFSYWVANICVKTDSDEVCTGKWGKGKSEVFKVKARNAAPWICTAYAVSGPTVESSVFSRDVYKECAFHGAPLASNYFDLVKP